MVGVLVFPRGGQGNSYAQPLCATLALGVHGAALVWGSPWGEGKWSHLRATQLSLRHPLNLSLRSYQESLLHSLRHLTLPQDVRTGSLESGSNAFPQVDAIKRGVLDQGKMASLGGVEEELGIGTLLAVPLTLSLYPHNPQG